MNALQLDRVNAFYGKSHILHSVSLQVKAGTLVALLGRNGAGKTTTIRAILGLTGKRVKFFSLDRTSPTRRPTRLPCWA